MWKSRKGKQGERFEGFKGIADGVYRSFSGCDVCWTCRFYHMEYFRCCNPVPEGGPTSEFVGIKIKNPEWFRCPRWTEGNR